MKTVPETVKSEAETVESEAETVESEAETGESEAKTGKSEAGTVFENNNRAVVAKNRTVNDGGTVSYKRKGLTHDERGGFSGKEEEDFLEERGILAAKEG